MEVRGCIDERWRHPTAVDTPGRLDMRDLGTDIAKDDPGEGHGNVRGDHMDSLRRQMRTHDEAPNANESVLETILD